MSQSACPEEGANAQNDVEQWENVHAAKTRLRAAMAHAGVSRIRSASGEYREDCAESQLGAPKVAWKRRLAPRYEFTALFQKAGSGMEGAGEARQSVPMVKGVDYIFLSILIMARSPMLGRL